VPVATAYTATEIFADSHIAARHDLVTVDDPVAGPMRQQSPFPRFVGEPARAPKDAPRLGEHTNAVLHELLGLAPEQLERLARAGVV
jgi:succinyl-CoA---D-citramalate CoA-transferase